MTSQRNMVLVLAMLVVMAVVSHFIEGAAPSPSPASRIIWDSFLFGVPLVLSGLLIAGKRWALMAGVMYGTIGLALDISTIVQELTRTAMPQTVFLSGVTGLLNFLLIAIGGRGFLDVISSPTPPTGRPPSLRSR